MQQGRNRLVFIAAVFPHQGADADQVRDVGNLFAFAALRAVDFLGPLQGFAISGADDHHDIPKTVFNIATSSFLLKLSKGGGGA